MYVYDEAKTSSFILYFIHPGAISALGPVLCGTLIVVVVFIVVVVAVVVVAAALLLLLFY